MASWEMGRTPHFIDDTCRKRTPRQRPTHRRSSLRRFYSTHSGRDGGVHVDDAADVGTYGVDGGVGAEPRRVRRQVGGSLLDHLPDDVELDLRREDSVTPAVGTAAGGGGGRKRRESMRNPVIIDSSASSEQETRHRMSFISAASLPASKRV